MVSHIELPKYLLFHLFLSRKGILCCVDVLFGGYQIRINSALQGNTSEWSALSSEDRNTTTTKAFIAQF